MSRKKILFHSFTLADTDDPDVYLMLAINSFLDTPKGKWVHDHAQDLEYHIENDQIGYRMRCILTGNLDAPQTTEYLLRWKD